MSDAELTALLEPIVRKWLSPQGLRFVEVRSGLDHDGEPSIFLDAVHSARSDEIDPDAVLGAIGEMQAALVSQEDLRFPYLRHSIPDLASAK